MRRTGRLLAAVGGVALVAGLSSGCGTGSGGVSDQEAELVVSVEGDSSRLVIDYTVTNTGDRTLVAYNRLENSPSQQEFVSDVNRVYVNRSDGAVEIAKKIDHPCQDQPDQQDCAGAQPVTWRIGGTVLEPGEELAERVELPARGEPGFIETRGKEVTFCLGMAVIDEDHPASADGLYPPTSPQTVLCGTPVPVT